MNQSESDRRLHYLRHMGIDVWQARHPLASQETFSEAGEAGMNWEELATAVAVCRLCPLGEASTQTVLGAGNRSSRIVVVGQAPVDAEGGQGAPFADLANELLGRMLKAIAWPRDQVYVTNLVKCPPRPGGAQALEIATCAPYLQQQLDLIQPALILAVGEMAAQQLLKTEAALASLRGRVHQYGVQGTPLVATHAPDCLLQSPMDKAQAWEDLKLARTTLDGV